MNLYSPGALLEVYQDPLSTSRVFTEGLFSVTSTLTPMNFRIFCSQLPSVNSTSKEAVSPAFIRIF